MEKIKKLRKLLTKCRRAKSLSRSLMTSLKRRRSSSRPRKKRTSLQQLNQIRKRQRKRPKSSNLIRITNTELRRGKMLQGAMTRIQSGRGRVIATTIKTLISSSRGPASERWPFTTSWLTSLSLTSGRPSRSDSSAGFPCSSRWCTSPMRASLGFWTPWERRLASSSLSC